jgi:hypothetical protein
MAVAMGSTPDDCTSLLSTLVDVKDLLRRWCRVLRPTGGVPEPVLQPTAPIEHNSIFTRQCMSHAFALVLWVAIPV